MSLSKTAVFIASRFSEFEELRNLLKRKIFDYPVVQLEPIDLNNGNVTHKPPINECLGFVRRSEFMILLLGDSYGTLVPNRDKSFTHLEYEEAIKEGSNTRVLVFCIGNSYEKGVIEYSNDPKLAAWQKQVEENHTLGFIDPNLTADEVSKIILDNLLKALYELRLGNITLESSDDFPDDFASEDVDVDDSEITALDARNAELIGITLTSDSILFNNTEDILRQPAAVAAYEQRQEADKAIKLRDYGTAITHLKRALGLKPLDLLSNYWLAKLYLSLGLKKFYGEIIEFAERGAKIAEHEGLLVRASDCYILAAKATRMASTQTEGQSGLNYAQLAVDTAPQFAQAKIELAIQLMQLNRKIEAAENIKSAYLIYPKSLMVIYQDPSLSQLRKLADGLRQELKQKFKLQVIKIKSVENEIVKTIGTLRYSFNENDLDDMTLKAIINMSYQSINRQYQLIQSYFAETLKKINDLDSKEKLTDYDTEFFRFTNNSNSIKIVSWEKQISELVSTEDIVFNYVYVGSTKLRPWKYKGRTTVKLAQILAQTNSEVTSANPNLFTYISDIEKIPVESDFQLLMKSLNNDKSQLNKLNEEIVNDEIQLNKHKTLRFFILSASCLFGLITLVYAKYYIWIAAIGLFSLIISKTNSNFNKLSAKLYSKKANRDYKQTEIKKSESKIEMQINDRENSISISRSILGKFELETLKTNSTLLPYSFKRLNNCSEGDLIRIAAKSIDLLSKEISREIVIYDDAPDWFNYSDIFDKSIHLYRVKSINKEKIYLSRLEAYVPKHNDVM